MSKSDTGSSRRFPRVNAESILAVRLLSGGAVLAVSKVVGLGGLMFEYGKRLRKGQQMEIEILAGVDLIKTRVRVAWCNKGEGGNWRVGVEFMDITDSAREKLLDSLLRRVYLDEETGG